MSKLFFAEISVVVESQPCGRLGFKRIARTQHNRKKPLSNSVFFLKNRCAHKGGKRRFGVKKKKTKK